MRSSMIRAIVLTYAALAVIMLADWKNFKHSNRSTQWFTIAVLLASGVIWVYLLTHLNAPRPAGWLERLLEPLDPVGKGKRI